MATLKELVDSTKSIGANLAPKLVENLNSEHEGDRRVTELAQSLLDLSVLLVKANTKRPRKMKRLQKFLSKI